MRGIPLRKTCMHADMSPAEPGKHEAKVKALVAWIHQSMHAVCCTSSVVGFSGSVNVPF